ncbi:hypothetical protein [Rhodopseudomonas parapalustris]
MRIDAQIPPRSRKIQNYSVFCGIVMPAYECHGAEHDALAISKWGNFPIDIILYVDSFDHVMNATSDPGRVFGAISCIALPLVAAGLLALSGMTNSARAQDASFGCKVLLCAAASSPSWSGIPYCVPVMHELFHRLARGHGWPTCPEGHASRLQYEAFKPCTAGMTPVAGQESEHRGGAYRSELPYCSDLSKPLNTCGRGHDDGCVLAYFTVPRERRSEPYFVDITTASGVQRFYFSLKGY